MRPSAATLGVRAAMRYADGMSGQQDLIGTDKRARKGSGIDTTLRPVAAAAVLAIIMIHGGGCAARLAPPQVDVGPASVAEVTDEAMALQFPVVLRNPNEQSLELQEFHYRLEVDGRTAFRGRWAALATLPARDAAEATLPAVVRFDGPGWAAADLPPSFEYRLQGELLYVEPGTLNRMLIDSGLKTPHVDFEASGRVSLEQ